MENKFSTLLAQIDINSYKISDNDKRFVGRIFSTPIEKYEAVLKRIGITSNEDILDAGCGYGQWSIAIRDLGNRVTSIDISEERVSFLRDLISKNGLNEINTKVEGIDNLSFPEASFDKIFCYSTFFIADCRKVLQDFKRVLRENGVAYITFNSLGFYSYLWETEANKTSDYSPRKVVLKALENSITYFEENFRVYGDMCISRDQMINLAQEAGFKVLHCGGDGTYNQELYPGAHFFAPQYKGLDSAMEIVIQKI